MSVSTEQPTAVTPAPARWQVPAPGAPGTRLALALGAGGALVLIGSLALPWYTLRVANQFTLGLASNALQWMTLSAGALLLLGLAALALLVRCLRGHPYRRGLALLPGLAVVLIVYRLAVPPSLPGSSPAYHLHGSVAIGPVIALISAVAMTAGVFGCGSVGAPGARR